MSDLTLLTAGRIEVVSTPTEQRTLIAAAAITAGNACYITTAGKADLADADGSGTTKAYGVATRTVGAGSPVTLIRRGVTDGFDLSALAYGAQVFTSATAGALADTTSQGAVAIASVVPANGQPLGSAPDKLLEIDISAGA